MIKPEESFELVGLAKDELAQKLGEIDAAVCKQQSKAKKAKIVKQPVYIMYFAGEAAYDKTKNSTELLCSDD